MKRAAHTPGWGAVCRWFCVLCSSFFVLCSLFYARSASAQAMPDISMMAGTPLPAPELPNGTVSVRLMREELGNNIVNHRVTLRSAQESKTADTDAQGRAAFTGFAPGTSVVATAEVDGESLQSRQFEIPERGGIRVALVSGLKALKERQQAEAEAAAKEPARPGVVTFGGETRLIFEFQDDNLNAFYILEIVNGARTPIDVGGPLVIELPQNAVGAAALQGSSPLATVSGTRVTITGPFPPGKTAVQVAYTLPYDGDAVTIDQPWPAPLEEAFVAVEQVGGLTLSSAQMPETQEADASGTRFLMARGPRLNANQPLTITISGLPHRDGTVRTVGVGLALLIIAIGFWAALTNTPAQRNETAKLAARREKLYAELVELERQRQAAKIDEQRYMARRQHLSAQLERILGELDRSPVGGGEGVAA
jgi:hypothetical protein